MYEAPHLIPSINKTENNDERERERNRQADRQKGRKEWVSAFHECEKEWVSAFHECENGSLPDVHGNQVIGLTEPRPLVFSLCFVWLGSGVWLT